MLAVLHRVSEFLAMIQRKFGRDAASVARQSSADGFLARL